MLLAAKRTALVMRIFVPPPLFASIGFVACLDSWGGANLSSEFTMRCTPELESRVQARFVSGCERITYQNNFNPN